jgi:anti-sigma-K factor RskA
MSGADGSEWDVMAGEYVLGLLDAAGAASVEQRARTEPDLAAAIAAWENRLDPLADLAVPVAPSDLLWHRIAGDLRPAQVPSQPPAKPKATPWRNLAFASMALAAGLAAFVLWSAANRMPVAPWSRAVALLAAPGSATAALRAQVTGAGTITVVPLRHLEVADGHQLGFWAWPASEKAPVLLGMISANGGQLRFPYPPREGTPVMVTLEAQGATRHAAPGPTLYLGLLVASSS